MNHKFSLFKVLILACIFFPSCKKGGYTSVPVIADTLKTNVYMAGYISDLQPVATYWKNESFTGLGPGKATGIALKGNDVYVVGYSTATNGQAVATYWKNGIRTVLADSINYSTANGIAISGNDIYISGNIDKQTSHLPQAVYWKNGIQNVLGDTAASSTALGVAIHGSDLYVAGNISVNNGPLNAVYWKNGQPVQLSFAQNESFSQLVSIALDGNDVYAAGRIQGIPSPGTQTFIATYWKNGKAVSFTDGNTFSVATGVLIKGNDVYVIGTKQLAAGTNSTAGYWKNGQFTALSNKSGFSNANTIALEGDDIYIGGRCAAATYSYACYWKNGVVVPLIPDKSSCISAITVVKQ